MVLKLVHFEVIFQEFERKVSKLARRVRVSSEENETMLRIVDQ